MSEVAARDGRLASRAIRALRAIEALEGISTGLQVVVFTATLTAIFTRLPGTFLHPQFFAEDGWVWYEQAYNLHWFRSLGIAQAGCIQMLQRLIAGVALLFPMQWAPLVMNLCGAVVQALPVTALLSARCTPWGPLPIRMLMAMIYVAIPNAHEIHIVATNAMWHLAVLEALLAFSVPPVGWPGRISDVVLFGIGAISGPFCIFLLPLVALYYWIRRQRWTLVVLALMLIGIIVQGLSLLHSVRSAGAPLGINPVRLFRIVGGNIFIDSMTGGIAPYIRIRWLGLISVAGLAIPIWGWRSAPLAVRLYFAFAFFTLIASLRDPLVLGTAPRWEVLANNPGIRYWFLPSLMFLWAAAWCAWGGRSNLVRYAGVVVLFVTAVGAIQNWTYPEWPANHFRADVDRFRTLKPGEHMTFSVYDPSGRKMELIRR